MDLNHLLNHTLEEFLLEYVSDKIEDVSELPEMLKEIAYLDNKQELIDQTTACEILEVDNAFAENYSLSENEIQIQYSMTFILQTFIDSRFIWRVQGGAQAALSIPNAGLEEWSVFDEQNSNFFREYEKQKESVRFQKIVYTDVECDTLYT